MTRGDRAGLGLDENVFATAHDADEVDRFRQQLREAHDRYRVDKSRPKLVMFIEPVVA